MLAWLSAWRARRQARKAESERQASAVERALEYFKRSRSTDPMHGVVLTGTNEWILVRVLFMEAHVPPSRAWYRISDDGGVVELSFEDVKHIDTAPWR